MQVLRNPARALIGAGLIACVLAAAPTHSAPVTYAGTLTPGVSLIGDANHAPGGAFSSPDLWTFYTFSANANEELDLVVRRTAGELDPFFGLWFGQESDTSAYFDMISSSSSTSWLGFADDELPPFVAGPGGDAALSFLTPGTGTYVVAVAGVSASGALIGDGFVITLDPGSGVLVDPPGLPEPFSAALLATALGLLGFFRSHGRGSRS